MQDPNTTGLPYLEFIEHYLPNIFVQVIILMGLVFVFGIAFKKVKKWF